MSTISDGPFDNRGLYRSYNLFPILNPTRWEKRLLNTFDTFISLFVVSPLVVSHWRGTWDFMDQFPRIFPGLNCMLFGLLIHCGLSILREPLHSKYNSEKSLQTNSSKLNLFLLKKVYTYVFSIACIMQW